MLNLAGAPEKSYKNPLSRRAFGVCLVSVTFGLVSGRLRSLADILDALSSGIVHGAPLIVVYLFAVQLYASLHFVFG